ncbi:MAG: class II aldolase/adducin family protein [Kiloniellales bacterium]|nr:class II aldolase/adducin family protein [Kiloniellales bacterium]
MKASATGRDVPPDSQMSDSERGTRVDLAACYRLVDLYGWSDLTSTHISARVPGDDGAFLINPFPSFFDQMRASDLVKVDYDGNLLSDGDLGINEAAITVHSAVHMARPDVQCVIHTHTTAGMAVSALDCGLLPMTQHALWFYNRIGYHDYEGIADDLAERERLVRDLGHHSALILRNHGLLTAADSIPNAFKMLYYLEKSCQAQLAAMAAVGEAGLRLPSAEVCEHAAAQYAKLTDFGDIDWPGHLRKLDALNPTYRA